MMPQPSLPRVPTPLLPLALCSALLAPLAPHSHAAEPALQFNRDIRPILSDNCFSCHGPDKAHRKGGLRLDLREEATQPAKSGEIAIKPGSPSESELVKRLHSKESDELMPPPEAHKKLTAAQKKTLEEWIRQGAEYQAHWAYLPPVRVAPPKLRDESLAQNAIDRFIQAKLEQRKISPSPEADRATLLRRLSLDLTGLPPTPEEVQAFAQDPSPEAYARQVERLLASPHFGERMAAHWLDLARYADTVGFHGDQNMNVWAYRDWVIESFNQNKPFDQFTIEQLAGDLLPNPTPAQRIATCFNRLNMVTREGGAQAKEYLTKYTADRVRTVGTTWLGSTFACAECHDHKFDPIATKDFYSLGAFFADVKQWGVYTSYGYTPEPELAGFTNEYPFPPELTVQSPALLQRARSLQTQIQALAKTATLPEDPLAAWRTESAAFLQTHPDGIQRLTSTRRTPAAPAAPAAPKPEAAPSAANKPAPKAPPKPAKLELEIAPPTGWIASITLDLLPKPETALGAPEGWLHVLDSSPKPGTPEAITLSGKDTTVKASFRLLRKGKATPLEIRHACASRSKPDYRNGAELLSIHAGWKTQDPTQPHRGVFLLDAPFRLQPEDKLLVSLETSTGRGNAKTPDCELTHVGVGVSPLVPQNARRPEMPAQLPEGDALRTEFLRCTASDRKAFETFKTLETQWMACRDGHTPVLVTQAVENPLPIRILPRGNWMDESGPVVQPETPHFLPASTPPSTPRKTRLDLARWIVSEQNPLTARVVMNRLWRQFFGNALSLQTDELGSQGEPPSHPELLDWLALEFREKGWDLKGMIRQIVHSHTYRQSAQLRRELQDQDPANRWLASQNPRRLEAEIVRDNALAIAGLLHPELGGPPVKPYQPAGYYQALQFPNRDYQASSGTDQYRRAVYSHWQRTFLHPMLANFDAPSREDCIALRSTANTPQQALTLLNDPSFVEAARFWAARLLALPAVRSDADRLHRMAAEALARPLRPDEQDSLLALLSKLRAEYAARPKDAESLLQIGQPMTSRSPESERLDRTELAAWTNLCRVVLNLHETITRY